MLMHKPQSPQSLGACVYKLTAQRFCVSTQYSHSLWIKYAGLKSISSSLCNKPSETESCTTVGILAKMWTVDHLTPKLKKRRSVTLITKVKIAKQRGKENHEHHTGSKANLWTHWSLKCYPFSICPIGNQRHSRPVLTHILKQTVLLVEKTWKVVFFQVYQK